MPIQYPLKYRVMQGADLLLREGGTSISQIALLSGFDSPSHFSKMFRRFYDCSPKEYRNACL
ncbi:MAG: helix-turn-helix transcriptional regulator [Lachnospiraceae bacterium]|nr:helix-turn-helix transcriptional regulator [Lachnospiraceae bacterium]MCI9624846.1 helix-turn-helix transcriptional regulator [Lachnospiraceae bacterium]